jgi:phenylacetaldehyde dehydrogenase
MNAIPAPNLPSEPPTVSPAIARFVQRSPRLLIDGEWVAPHGDGRIPVIDPATERQIAEVANADAHDVDRAVRAARAAFESGPWPQMRPAEREVLMWRLAELLERNAAELAELESLDNGKPISMARMIDVPGAIQHLRYMAGWASKIEGSTVQTSLHAAPGTRFHAYTVREPVGVVAQIIPWNFPLLMAALKLAPVLATGCTSVLKPAEQTPLTALRLGELIIEAGFPPGVVNIVTGLGETTGAALVAHPDVDKIAFTGSTEVGKLINIAATPTLKRVSLELGGKSPVIVLPDVDPTAVAAGAAQAVFFNSGQVCVAGSRLFIQRKVFDKVIEGVSEASRSIVVGPGLDERTQMGPLVSAEQRDRVMAYLQSGRAQGASIAAGGEAPQRKGYFVNPTVVVDVNPDMKIVREEIFGPVVVAQRFDELDEVAKWANDTPYGLAASVWSNDLRAVQRLVPKIKAGTVWVNCHAMIDVGLPFGGYKQSGFGREQGRAGIELYTELKSVCMAV